MKQILYDPMLESIMSAGCLEEFQGVLDPSGIESTWGVIAECVSKDRTDFVACGDGIPNRLKGCAVEMAICFGDFLRTHLWYLSREFQRVLGDASTLR